jgi:hypothetical protein
MVWQPETAVTTTTNNRTSSVFRRRKSFETRFIPRHCGKIQLREARKTGSAV